MSGDTIDWASPFYGTISSFVPAMESPDASIDATLDATLDAGGPEASDGTADTPNGDSSADASLPLDAAKDGTVDAGKGEAGPDVRDAGAEG